MSDEKRRSNKKCKKKEETIERWPAAAQSCQEANAMRHVMVCSKCKSRGVRSLWFEHSGREVKLSRWRCGRLRG
jgi:hypothetical protein